MNQIWTLHIENFARIKEADITVSPLMCFVGDNNSGKSYVMSLLWGIMSNEEFFCDNPYVELESYKCCKNFILEHLAEDITINDNAALLYLTFFNDLLDVRKDELMQRIFNQVVPIGKIEIRNFSRSKEMSLEIRRSEKKAQMGFKRALELITSDENDLIGINLPIDDKYLDIALWRANVNIAFSLFMTDWLTATKTITEALPIYLPASRTGFLMTYRQIASGSLKGGQPTLTLPYVQFLQLLLELTDSDSQVQDGYKELVNFIRSELLHGTIKVKNDGNIIRYQASDMKAELPLSVTSSVVTELASLLLLLTTTIPLRLLIIEEPEAHLHPALQKKIAQLLVRFVHSGIPVWITTHSDTIIHHFNNMLNLNALAQETKTALLEEFDYGEEDLLNSDEINLYQFERDETKTTIQKLPAGKYGFKSTSFNKAIDDLTREIFAFQEED